MANNLSLHSPNSSSKNNSSKNNSSKNSSSKNNNKSLTPYPPNKPQSNNTAPRRRSLKKAKGKKLKRAKKSIKR